MNNEAYTAYPSEAEVLLSEGCKMYVLSVDKGIRINATSEGEMAYFKNKVVTVIHLFHQYRRFTEIGLRMYRHAQQKSLHVFINT